MKKKSLFLIICLLCLGNLFSQKTINLESSSSSKSASREIGIVQLKSSSLFDKATKGRTFSLNPALKSSGFVMPGDTLDLSLFTNSNYRALVDHISEDVNGTLVIRSRVVGYKFGYCILTVSQDGGSLLRISIPELNEVYTSRSNKTNDYSYLLKLDVELLNDIEDGHSHVYDLKDTRNEDLNSSTRSVLSTKSGTGPLDHAVIDVMLVYTQLGKDWADANEGGINNTIAMVMARSNMALDNSEVFASMRLVYSNLVTFTDSRGSSAALSDLRYDRIPNVHTWRDQYGADLVQMLFFTNDYGGLAYPLKSTSGRPEQGFSVISIQRANITTNPIHEMGHNIGCGHHKSQTLDPGPQLYSNSAGWDWIGNDGNRYSSLMTYQNAAYWADGFGRPNVLHFSNPNVFHMGQPTGDAGSNNAATIRAMKHVIAAYRASVGCSAPIVSARYNNESSKSICIGEQYTLSANIVGGGSCTGTWEYAWYTGNGSDNTYWNGSTWTNSETWGDYSSIANVSPSQNTTYKVKVRCTGETTCASTDNVGVSVTVFENSIGGTVSGGTTICAGLNSGSLNLTGNTGAVAKWQWSTDLSNWNDIIHTGTSYVANTVMQTTHYRAVVKNGPCSEAFSSHTTVNVTASPELPIAGHANRCGTGTVSISATPHDGSQINWFSSDVGGTELLSNSTSFTTPSISVSTTYYAEAYSTVTSCKSVNRVAVVAGVNGAPVIVEQPQEAEVCVNVDNARFIVVASGGELSYQWQENSGSGWQNINDGGIYSGATNDTLLISLPPSSMNTYQYRCVVSSGCPPDVTSNSVLLNVSAIYCGNNGDYRSRQSGNWNSTNTWQIFSSGEWIDASTTPGSTNNVNITIRNTHNVTHNVSNYTAGSSNKILVETGGTLTINNSSSYWTNFNTLTVRSGAIVNQTVGGVRAFGATLIEGTFVNSSTKASPTSFDGGCTIAANAIYRHNVNGGTIPTLTWDAGSTLEITGVTSTLPTATGTYQNVVYNSTGQGSSVLVLESNFNSILGDFTLKSTGSSGVIVLGNTATAKTMTIGGNFIIEGGSFAIRGAAAGSNNHIVNVKGDYLQTGGTFTFTRTSGSTTNSTLELEGDFILSGGTIQNSPNNDPFGTIKLKKVGEQVFVKTGGAFSKLIHFEVLENSILNLGTSVIDGSTGSFTLASGGGIITAHAGGIASSGASGSIQVTGTRTYNTNADYTFNGSLAQVTGSGLPASVRNLTINNGSGVSLSNNLDVSNVLTLSNGVLDVNSRALSIVNSNSNAIVGGGASAYVCKKLTRSIPIGAESGTYLYPVGINGVYYPMELNNTEVSSLSNISVEVFPTNSGGTAGEGLLNISNTEYWLSEIVSGSLINSVLSLSRTSGLEDYDAIARSSSMAGVYENLEGFVESGFVRLSNNTGSSLGYFTLAKIFDGGCIAPNISAQYDGLSSKTICLGESYLLSANTELGNECVDWEYAWFTGDGSDNTYWNGSTWTNAETWGAYQNIPNVAPTTNTTYKVKVRCVAEPSCSRVDNIGVSVTVNPSSAVGAVSSNQTICAGTSPADISVASATGVVQWKRADNSAFDVNVVDLGTDDLTLTSAQIGVLTETKYFRAEVTSGSCAPVLSDVVTITVNPAASVGAVSDNQVICSGNAVADISIASANGTIQWKRADNLAFDENVIDLGDNSLTLTSAQIGTLTSSKYFRAEVSYGSCSPAISEVVSVTVNPPSAVGAVSSNQTICAGVSPADISVASATGVVQWKRADNSAFDVNVVDLGTDNLTLTSAQIGVLTETKYFRAEVTSGSCAPVLSDVVTITVNPAASVGAVSGDQVIASGEMPADMSVASANGTIQWKQADNLSFDLNVQNVGSDNLILLGSEVGVLTSTKYFRAEVTVSSCTPVVSSIITVTVNPAGSVGDYRTKATGNWNAAATWETWNGSAWVESGTPTSASGAISIRNGHTVTVTASVTVDQVVIEAGGQVTIGTSTLTIANGAGDDFIVRGVLRTTSASNYITISTGAVLYFDNGSIYEHAGGGTGTIPIATWNVNSTCKILGITSQTSAITNIGQSFGNFEWNCSGQTSNYVFGANKPTAVNGSFIVTSTGSGSLSIGNTSTSSSLTVNNMEISGGNFFVTNTSASNTHTLTVNGDFLQTGGAFNICRTNSNGTYSATINGTARFSGGTTRVMNNTGTAQIASLTIVGNTIIEGGTLDLVSSSSGTGPAGRLFLRDNLTLSLGELSYTPTSTTGSSGVYFDGSGSQTFTHSGGTLSSVSGGAGRRFYYKTSSGPAGLNEVYNSSVEQTTINGSEGSPTTGYAAWPTSGALIKNVTIDNTAGVTLSSNKTINDNLHLHNGVLNISNPLALADGATIIRSAGSLSTAPNFNSNVNIVYNQHSGLITTSFELPASDIINDFTVNNSHGVALDKTAMLHGTLFFNQGKLFTSASNLLVMNNGSQVVQNQEENFIDGPCRKIGNSEFLFPIGNNGHYAPLKISAPALVTDHFTAQYFNSSPNSQYSVDSKESTVDNVSNCEYWQLDRTNGNSGVRVSLSWANRSCNVASLNDVMVARWNGTVWSNHGNTAVNGDLNSGFVTSDVITNFSPFTIGAKLDSPLYVQLSDFGHDCAGENIVLKWTTASEVNNDFFTIQHSADGIHWSDIDVVEGTGNSNQSTHYRYVLKDNSLKGYFRLKQTDFDGTTSLHNLISVDCESEEKSYIIYPNPSNGVLNVRTLGNNESYVLRISDILGVIRHEEVLVGDSVLNIAHLSMGLYTVRIESQNKVWSYKLIVSN